MQEHRMWAFAVLATIALLADLGIHIASFVCVDPRDWIHPEWAATVGFYAMFGAVVLLSNIVEARRERRAKLEGRLLPSEPPLWFKPISWIIIAYMLLSVFVGFSAIRRGDVIRQRDGTFVADPGHGHPVVPISEAEYHRVRRLGVRAGSGFFLGAYLMVVCDAVFTLSGQKRFKSPDQATRSFSLVLIRCRRFGGD